MKKNRIPFLILISIISTIVACNNGENKAGSDSTTLYDSIDSTSASNHTLPDTMYDSSNLDTLPGKDKE